jgi:hypothetical protein
MQSNSKSDLARVSGIDFDIQLVFSAEHLSLLLPHLAKTGLALEVVDKMIDSYIASGEVETFERWILEYGQSHLNPLINNKLKRKIDHPTFNNLLRFALKDQIDQHPTIIHLRKSKEKVL